MAKDLYHETFGPDDEFFDESENSKTIDEMEDPDEVDAALEIISEKIDETVKDTSSQAKSEPPKKSSVEDEGDTSDKGKTDDEKKAEEDKAKAGEDLTKEKVESKLDAEHDDKSKAGEDGTGADDFKLTDEVIEKHPEEVKGILEKYKDKGRDEIAKAAASAIALKSKFTKDNQSVIDSIMKGFEDKSNDELLDILIDTQKETGAMAPKTVIKYEDQEIDLPSFPENNQELKTVLNKTVFERLRAKYPDMPDVDNTENVEYKEWRRDYNNDNPDNSFLSDLKDITNQVETEFSKVIFIEQNLSNLYQDSPAEILPLLNQENYARLKALNDEPMQMLVDDINDEIEEVQKYIGQYGLTDKDLELDFTITKDDKGYPYNPVLNKLITKGKTADGRPIPNNEIISRRGNTFWLNKGKLLEAFKKENEHKIITTFVSNKTAHDNVTKETLKQNALREAGSAGSGGGKGSITQEVIDKTDDPAAIDKIIANLGGQS